MNLIEFLACYRVPLMISIVIGQAIFWLCMRSDFPVRKGHLWKDVGLRLHGYSLLKPGSVDSHSTGNRTNALSKDDHEVLLGTLKKVEQKNGILVTVIVFALSVIVSSHLSPGDYGAYDFVLAIFIVSLIAPLYLAFVGIVQLDQRNFRHLDVKHSEVIAASLLQDALIKDLMVKERAFRFAAFFTKWSVVLFLLVVASNAVLVGYGEAPVPVQLNSTPQSDTDHTALG